MYMQSGAHNDVRSGKSKSVQRPRKRFKFPAVKTPGSFVTILGMCVSQSEQHEDGFKQKVTAV